MVFDFLRVPRRILIPLLVALLLAVLGQASAQAQEQSSQPDMQEMQKKLLQLEKELQELKQQMNAGSGIAQQAVPGPSVPDATDNRQAVEHSEEPKPSNSINFYG
jgi:seryl-tRNA synthetase